MKLIFGFILSLIILSACSHNTTSFDFTSQKQPIPEGYGRDIQAEVQQTSFENEFMTNADGMRIFKAGMYGFSIGERDKQLFIETIFPTSILNRTPIQAQDEIESINGDKAVNFVREGFDRLDEVFMEKQLLSLTIQSSGKERILSLMPVIEYDLDHDDLSERLLYYHLDAPYRSEIVVLDSITQEVQFSFDVIKTLASIPTIETLRVDFFDRNSFVDRNSDGALDLMLFFQDVLDSYAVMLTFTESAGFVMDRKTPEGTIQKIIFPLQSAKNSTSQVEFQNFDGGSSEEIVFWKASWEQPDLSDLLLTAEVYVWDKDSAMYTHNKVFSGQFERQKRLEMLQTVSEQEQKK